MMSAESNSEKLVSYQKKDIPDILGDVYFLIFLDKPREWQNDAERNSLRTSKANPSVSERHGERHSVLNKKMIGLAMQSAAK